MRLGLGLSLTGLRRASPYDAEDLAKGTLLLGFVAFNEPTLQLNFVAQDYRAWVDDSSWPYGVVGVFKRKA